MLHRDLKPENILIKLNGSEEHPNIRPSIKIADFGLSKMGPKNADFNNVVFTTGCGSDYFLAPEVYKEHYNCKADVFSLGEFSIV